MIGIVFWFLHVLSCLFHDSSVSSVDESVSLQKGFTLLLRLQLFMGWMLWFLILWRELSPFSFQFLVGLVLLRHGLCGYEVVISLLAVGILCFSACVPRLGDHDKSMGVARLSPFLPHFSLWSFGHPEDRCVIESWRSIPICQCSLHVK